MLTTATGTATASQTGITIADSYLETRSLILTGTESGRLQQTLIEDIEDNYTYDGTGARVTGRPSHYAADGTLITFNVLPDKAYPYQHVYYAAPNALGTATTTNFLTTKYPTMLRAACMMLATQFTKADDQQAWEVRTLAEIGQANREDDKRYRDMDLRVMIG